MNIKTDMDRDTDMDMDYVHVRVTVHVCLYVHVKCEILFNMNIYDMGMDWWSFPGLIFSRF